MPQHERFIRETLRLAREGIRQGSAGPFGSVVVRDGEIIAGGWNQVLQDSDPTAHAEVVAIRRAGARLGQVQLQGCILYASCEPCPMCLGAAYWAQVDAIYFSASRMDADRAGFGDDYILRQLRLGRADRALPQTILLPDEGIAVFDDFIRQQKPLND